MRSITWGAMRGLRGLGAAGQGQGYTQLNDGSIVFANGSVYGPDGQLITSDLSASAVQLSDGATVDQQGVYYDGSGNQIGLTVFAAKQGGSPKAGGWTDWLNQPVAAGWPSNGVTIGLAAVAAAFVSLVGRRGGKRR